MLRRIRQSPFTSALLLLLGVELVWGTTFTLVKAALDVCTPLLFNLLRMLVATFALAIVNHRVLRRLTPGNIRDAALAGIFLALGYQLQTAGLGRTTPSKSAFITGLVVVLVPLLVLFPRIRPAGMGRTRWNGIAGAFIAFVGLVLLTTPPGSARTLFSGIGPGEWLTLGCALAFAAHLLVLAHVSPRMDARTLGTLQIAFAALAMLITMPLEKRPHVHFTPLLVAALLITGLLGTAAAFTIQSYAQRHIPPATTALIVTLEPVFAWLTSLLVLHERLSHRALTGAGLILAAILLAELWPSPPQLGHLPLTE